MIQSNKLVGLFVALAFCFAFPKAIAESERLTVSQNADQTIVVTLLRFVNACSVGDFFGPPTVAVSGSNISINLSAPIPECAGPDRNPPRLTSIPLNLGRLTDGSYRVQWTITVYFNEVPVNVSSRTEITFVMDRGALLLPQPVPINSLGALLILFCLISLTFAFFRLDRKGGDL